MSEDLRIKKTKKIIKDTFITLMQNHNYQDITVKSLCEEALINRNTFYLHYDDKDNLIQSLMQESIERLKLELKDLSFLNIISLTDYNHFQTEVKKIVTILNKDIELYRVVLNDNYLSGYFYILEDAFLKHLINLLKLQSCKDQVTIKYIVSGIVGVLKDWITHETLSVDETATILSKLTYNNILSLL